MVGGKAPRLIGFLVCFMLMAYAFVAFATLPATLADIKKVLPQAHSYTHKLDPLDYYEVKDKRGGLIGVAFVTSSISPEVCGYIDEIDVLVGMDLKGQVKGVAILSHQENPDYLDRIIASGFLKHFVGRSVDRGFGDIEAVTGATVSSEAIKKDIQTAAFEVTKKLLETGAVKREMINQSPFDLIRAAATVLLIGGVLAVTFMPRKRWLRYVVWGGAIGIVGVWLNSPITIGTFVDIGSGLFPTYLPLLILFVFALLAVLIKGNFYCAYVCPFGALQEFAHRVKLPKCRPSERAHRNASWLRWIILILSVFAIATAVYAFRTIEPFALCFALVYQPLVWIHAGVVLFAALFLIRPWCRYFCPTGAVLDLVSQLSGKIRRGLRKKRES